MTTLLAWLRAHHYSPIMVTNGHTWRPTYRTMHSLCAHHHQATALALYAHHAVMYCYTLGHG